MTRRYSSSIDLRAQYCTDAVKMMVMFARYTKSWQGASTACGAALPGAYSKRRDLWRGSSTGLASLVRTQ